ncbi:Cytochrome b-c1 complex subunit Rieske, mitochondrial [Schistosoma japonicum]|uniref:Cytochrome b-c1 complex subunit Rieske, mitochondrial n=1 Tax=Schistosoma japonicum TaxID=6182 RepID=C1LMN4_SCHJA|nr:Cytochrome b-c1 complex subunit Rieske, mitochondrial [Schistosoma japonicum]CAX75962.1 ubiquinol-cytochrome c reductase, Rieske iron-sulfur polypeptide 1 [Schistosoma japonicum]
MRYFKNLGAVVKCRTIPLSCEKTDLVSVLPKTKNALPPVPIVKSPHSLLQSLPSSPFATCVCSFSAPMQIRFAHTDVTNVPDFTNYRVDSTKDPHSRAADTDLQRKVFTYTMMFAATVIATTSAKYTIKTFIKPLGPSTRTMAEASTEVNLAAIPEGKNITVKWRNKPLFIRHRSAEEIARERAVPLTSLRDPQKDEDRVKEDKWLICVGVCTHLGCIPIAHSGDFPGGYYCPCHGSHYDASGRIRKGPAPLNLEVPQYKFVDENTVIVG